MTTRLAVSGMGTDFWQVTCVGCNATTMRLVAEAFGWWRVESIGLGARRDWVCSWCAPRLVYPIEKKHVPQFDPDQEWFPGFESIQSQFDGAGIYQATYPPGTDLDKVYIPREIRRASADDPESLETSTNKNGTITVRAKAI